MKDTVILGIESSCDETTASVVVNGRRVLSNVIASQVDCMPNMAEWCLSTSRKHVELILPVIDSALKEANVSLEDIDGIAVTYGPALWGHFEVLQQLKL